MHALRAAFVIIAIVSLAMALKRPLASWRSDANVSVAAIHAEPSAFDPAGALAAQIRSAPEYAAFFHAYAAAFPADYADLARRFAASPADGTERTPDADMIEAVSQLRHTRGVLAARARGPALDRIFQVQLAVMAALAKTDPRLCVEFLYGVSSPAFLSFSSRRRGLIASLGDAALSAILDGKASQVDRPAPSDGDFQDLVAALTAHGLEQSEIEALLDGRTSDPPLSDARLCAAGLVYLDVLHAMPDKTRRKIYSLAVELMAGS